MDWYLLVFLVCMAVVAVALGYAISELIHLNRRGGGVPEASRPARIGRVFGGDGR